MKLSFAISAVHPSSLLLYPFPSGVWCNAGIRVLGTRGDSSILSSPTKTQNMLSYGRSGNTGDSDATEADF